MFIINERITKFKNIIQNGYEMVNKLWKINQDIEFDSCKGKSINGRCIQVSKNSYKIKINKDLVKDEDVLEVVIHELLHSFPEVYIQGHKGDWKERANIIKQIYNINVKRTNSFEKSKTYNDKKSSKEYHFSCSLCNTIWIYHRKPKWFDRLNKVKCPYCKDTTIEYYEE